MSKDSTTNLDSVPSLLNEMMLLDVGHLPSKGSASSAASSTQSDGALLYTDARTDDTLTVFQSEQNAQNGLNPQRGFDQSTRFSDAQSQGLGFEHAFHTDMAYPSLHYGISKGTVNEQEVEVGNRPAAKRQLNYEANDRQSDRQTAGKHRSPGFEERRSEESRVFSASLSDIGSRNAEKKKSLMIEKRRSADDALRQNSVEKKPVRILQRPSSVTANHVSEVSRQEASDREDAIACVQRKGHRKKTLSLNPEEREALESLIEQVIIGGFDENVSDSDDPSCDEEAEEGRHNLKPVTNIVNEKSTRNEVAAKGLDKLDRDTRSETPKGSGFRNENNGRGRKFVKETGKNMGRGKEQGKRRDNSKPKDNRRFNDFQQGKPNSPVEDKEKQNMTNVNIFPAQLKVAMKHMESLPPRFLRRLQTGQSRMSGSDPALSKAIERHVEGLQLEDHRAAFAGQGQGKPRQTKERAMAGQKTIRNLLTDLAMYDDDNPTPSPSTEGNGFQLCGAGETDQNKLHSDEMLITSESMSAGFHSPNSVQNAVGMGSAARDGFIGAKPSRMNGPDPFQLQRRMFQQNDLEKDFLQNGKGGMTPPLNMNTEFSGSDQYIAHSRHPFHDFDNSAAAANAANKKTTFSVNAPEFVSMLFDPNNGMKADGRRNDMISGQPENGGPLSYTLEADRRYQLPHNRRLVVDTVPYRKNMMQPDFVNASGQSAPFQPQHMVHGMPRDSTTLPSSAYMDLSMPPLLSPISNGMIPPPPAPPPPHSMNLVPYPPAGMMPFAPGKCLAGYSNQPAATSRSFLATSVELPASAAGEPQVQWYPGGAYSTVASNQVEAGHGLVARYEQQMVNGAGNGWMPSPYKSYVQTTLPFEMGRQKVSRLICDGKDVMVVLVGRTDGNRLSMLSELQANINGALLLNLRNGMCPSNDEKAMEMHQWNFRQALEAVETRKNPIIIDLSFAQHWQMHDFIRLGQARGYHVEVINCDETGLLYRGTAGAGVQSMSPNVWDERMQYQRQQQQQQQQQQLNLMVNGSFHEVDVPAGSDDNGFNIPAIMNNGYRNDHLRRHHLSSFSGFNHLEPGEANNLQNSLLSVPTI